MLNQEVPAELTLIKHSRKQQHQQCFIINIGTLNNFIFNMLVCTEVRKVYFQAKLKQINK